MRAAEANHEGKQKGEGESMCRVAVQARRGDDCRGDRRKVARTTRLNERVGVCDRSGRWLWLSASMSAPPRPPRPRAIPRASWTCVRGMYVCVEP